MTAGGRREVCPPDHAHEGTSVCYIQHRCGCDACRRSQAERHARRKRLKLYGRWDSGLVAADPVRAHLRALGEYGIGWKRSAALAAVSKTTVYQLLYGRSEPGRRHGERAKRVKRETAERILALRPDVALMADAALVPSRGARRRVEALVAAGWPVDRIARRLGRSGSNLWTTVCGDHVRVSTHREIAALFDELALIDPPCASNYERAASERARRRARTRGWLPALAWDDIDLDEAPPAPDEEPIEFDEVTVLLAIDGALPHLSPGERRECVRRLHAAFWSDRRIAERIGCADKTVFRIRHELELRAHDNNDLKTKEAA